MVSFSMTKREVCVFVSQGFFDMLILKIHYSQAGLL